MRKIFPGPMVDRMPITIGGNDVSIRRNAYPILGSCSDFMFDSVNLRARQADPIDRPGARRCVIRFRFVTRLRRALGIPLLTGFRRFLGMMRFSAFGANGALILASTTR